jgi:predicted DNA-binding antitoxin AbrB/MazE fold protein
MSRRIKLLYEDGVFKPLEPVDWLENQRNVEALIEEPQAVHPFAGWVGDMPDEDAKEMRRIIEEEFEQIDPDDWK